MRKYIIEEKAFAENALQGDFGRRQRRNKMSFSENLKKLRKSYEISQKAFARELNVSQSTVASWETGAREPSIETLLSLSAFFNVSVEKSVEIINHSTVLTVLSTVFTVENVENFSPFCTKNREQSSRHIICED